jgi:Protein of unknown function with HXXEE motif
MTLLLWASLLAVTAHLVEEFVFPGGFLAWHRRYRPEHAASITPRFAIVVNGLLLFLLLAIDINGPSSPIGIFQWLTLAALLITNAAFHIRAVINTRAYSPGVVTAAFLYVPLGVYGYYWLLRTGAAPVGMAAVALVLGGSYPFVSTVLHRMRSAARTHA